VLRDRGEVTRGLKNCIMRSFITCTLPQIKLESQIKEDEIGRACSINGIEEGCIQGVMGKSEGKIQ
jgi:hypothetical protein